MVSLSRKLLPSTSALAAFDSVARLGSFSAAAEELSLTQGAISRQVSGLEEQLGIQLFDRSSRGVSLTSAGAEYAKVVANALSQIRSASLQVMTKRHSDQLNLAILPTFGTRWLMPRIPQFVARHPEITLNFATRIGVFDFDRDGIDMAIHIGQPDWPGAECTFLMEEMVAPVSSPAFLASHPIRKGEDLLRLPLLHMASRPGAWNHWFESLGIAGTSSQGMRFEQFGSVAQACIAGLGVALMPLFLIDSELAAGQLVEVFPHQVRSTSAYYAVAPLSKADFRPVVAFRAWLIEEVGRYREEVVGW
ncbi:LysR family transcriptional regulator [Neorhizobium galegae]|uniref:LysR family transcriptional regulator n=1 Tax=Neorhizobium galegae TaxID=399 RepID=UPI000621B707|nr:LysR family transcriptional regulator [Neorhizobium galegae]CDZ25940.1 Transcriptional regulator GcdR [Neorhizobium galegae bv. officinalis]KAA9388413.1 LysR family transcriptional regulator [Neorhizobium galegae]KAB1114860.1 LysR family transcriptional regulator [Neorhizobium galegae]MCM2497143.1 LysR family transcriptional regulator [Neorhizobium galegae]MCQ1771211.1 LysR family transcriptional regulator [Neorhizobium galegae]